MELYLLRHGIAEDAPLGGSDSERALTPEGKRKLRELLRVVHTAGVRPSMIVTSPYRRARETAVIAAKALAYKDELIAANSLVPHAHVHEFWEEIRMHRAEPQLLLVSHEPLLSAAAAFLIGAPNARIDFKKGAMMRLDVDGFSAQPVATLKWYLTARLVT